MPRDLTTSNPPRVAARWRLLRRLLPVSAALALTFTFGTADAWAKGNPPAPPAVEAPAETAPRTEPTAPQSPIPGFDFADSYAVREANAAALQDFEGGDVVIIGSGGLILVLLIVLIILLL
jgi:hypothetical protein